MSGRRIDRAIALAVEYEDLVSRGDVDRAEDARRMIDTLVGRWIDGPRGSRVWGWPSCVVAYARGSARTDLPGYVPASEAQS